MNEIRMWDILCWDITEHALFQSLCEKFAMCICNLAFHLMSIIFSLAYAIFVVSKIVQIELKFCLCNWTDLSFFQGSSFWGEKYREEKIKLFQRINPFFYVMYVFFWVYGIIGTDTCNVLDMCSDSVMAKICLY